MKTILKNISKPDKGVVVKDLDNNMFSFQFFSTVDRDYVLNEGPWSFDGSILLLKQVTGSEQIADIKFDSARFWVKAYNVPAKQQTHAFGYFLASKVGTFVACDEETMYGVDKALCFRTDIAIDRPLKRV